MNKEEINELTAKIESCWDENNPEEYELITSGG